MRRQLAAQRLTHLCELRRQGVEAGRRFGACGIAHLGVDLLQRGHGADHALVQLRELGKRHRRKRGIDLLCRFTPGRRGREEQNAAVLTAADERHSSEPVHHGHGIGEAVQCVSPKDGVFVDERVGLAPVVSSQ